MSLLLLLKKSVKCCCLEYLRRVESKFWKDLYFKWRSCFTAIFLTSNISGKKRILFFFISVNVELTKVFVEILILVYWVVLMVHVFLTMNLCCILLKEKFTFSLLTSVISPQLTFSESEINRFWSKFLQFLINIFDSDFGEFAKKFSIIANWGRWKTVDVKLPDIMFLLKFTLQKMLSIKVE